VSSREAALAVFGPEMVDAYERVKRFYTRYGRALERVFAGAVGGRVGRRGEPDVVTPLGGFEFCASSNTKNAAGNAAQVARVGVGRVVQVSGRPARGRITGVAFLALHGVDEPELVAGELELLALELARVDQLELELVG